MAGTASIGFKEHLRSRHEGGLLSRQVGCEVLMKLRGIKVSETVRRLPYSSRLAEVTWEALSVVSLVLSGIWHVSSDVHQTGDRWTRPRFSNYCSSVAVSNKNARSILKSNGTLGSGDILFEGCLGILHEEKLKLNSKKGATK